MAKSTKVLVKVAPKGSDPKVPVRVDFDIRDRLAELVGRGNSISPDDKAAIYGNLVSSLGRERADKVMNHAYIFNQRGDVQGLPLEEKLRSFYTIGSNDPDVGSIISKSKTLGYGAVPGFRESVSDINQQLLGRNTSAVGAIDPEIKKRIMVRVNK